MQFLYYVAVELIPGSIKYNKNFTILYGICQGTKQRLNCYQHFLPNIHTF